MISIILIIGQLKCYILNCQCDVFKLSLLVIFICILLSSNNLHAQQYTLEPLDSILVRIQQNTQSNQTTRVDNYNATKSKQWYHLLPSVGYNAVAQGISINFNLSSIISISDKKRAIQYQISEWKRTDNIELIKKTIQAKTAYKLLENELQKAIQHQQITEIDSIAHLIKKKAYENHKLNTEDYLEAKRRYLTHQEKTYDLRQKIVELANQLSLLQQKELFLLAPFIKM